MGSCAKGRAYFLTRIWADHVLMISLPFPVRKEPSGYSGLTLLAPTKLIGYSSTLGSGITLVLTTIDRVTQLLQSFVLTTG